MWELTTSLRLLAHEPDSVRHGPWVLWARRRVDAAILGLLAELMTTPYNYPDFLTPPPGPRPRSFVKELAGIAALDPCAVREEIEQTAADGVPPALQRVFSGVNPMAEIAAALDAYWQQVLAPVWPRIRRALAADVAYRADDLAADGLHALLNRLHPMVTFNGEALRIQMRRCSGVRSADTVHDLALVPCAFGWPELLVVATPGLPVSISYGPRGAAALWHQPSSRVSEPLIELVGRSRAAILSLLDLPVSSTQIAEQTGLSLSAVTQHLDVLRRSGLVSTRKAGRTAWTARTELGSRLVSPSGGAHEEVLQAPGR